MRSIIMGSNILVTSELWKYFQYCMLSMAATTGNSHVKCIEYALDTDLHDRV